MHGTEELSLMCTEQRNLPLCTGQRNLPSCTGQRNLPSCTRQRNFPSCTGQRRSEEKKSQWIYTVGVENGAMALF